MKKGISLVEVLIVMTVLAILMTSFSAIFGNSIKTLRQEMTQSQVQAEAQTLLDRIQTEIKKGRTTEASWDTFTKNSQTLIFSIPAIDNYENQNILYNGSNILLDRVVYYKIGNSLHRIVFANPLSARMNENNLDKILSNNISSLNFNYVGNGTDSEIDTSIVISKKVGNFYRTASVSGKASFRNQP